jgi:hypothetical protein
MIQRGKGIFYQPDRIIPKKRRHLLRARDLEIIVNYLQMAQPRLVAAEYSILSS